MEDTAYSGPLDRPTAADGENLRVLAEAQQVASSFLTEDLRSRMQRAVDRFDEAVRAHASWQQRLDAAQRSADASSATPGPPSPETKHLWAVQREAPEDPAKLKDSAEEAREALVQDDALRAPHSDLLARSRQAREDLLSSVEQRVRESLLAGDVPVWFTSALGASPSRGGDAERWLDAAVQLVLFRFRHGVVDAVLPCGRLSQYDSAVGRRGLELLAECDRLRQ